MTWIAALIATKLQVFLAGVVLGGLLGWLLARLRRPAFGWSATEHGEGATPLSFASDANATQARTRLWVPDRVLAEDREWSSEGASPGALAAADTRKVERPSTDLALTRLYPAPRDTDQVVARFERGAEE
jgi:hypothetical protein